MGKRRDDTSGAGRGIALVLILVELCGAGYLGVTLLKSFGTETLMAVKFAPFWAAIAGVISYIALYFIPGIRWLTMAAMVLLWAFLAYSLGLVMIGDNADGFKWVSHKGPYIGGVLAAVFRAAMYRT